MKPAFAGWRRAAGAKPARLCASAATPGSSCAILTRTPKKKLIERARRESARQGLAVWTEDEAGPCQTRPYPGQSRAEHGQARRQPHEYLRNGAARLLTLFRPGSGEVRVRGVLSAANAVLHPWLRQELLEILAHLPAPGPGNAEANQSRRASWRKGRKVRITLPEGLPPLRLLLVRDNLKGHLTPSLAAWLFAHGVMPVYTPLSGSWLGMAEFAQRILRRRALDRQHPQTPEPVITALEDAAASWNREPTPFERGGRRHARQLRSRQRRHMLGGIRGV